MRWQLANSLDLGACNQWHTPDGWPWCVRTALDRNGVEQNMPLLLLQFAVVCRARDPKV